MTIRPIVHRAARGMDQKIRKRGREVGAGVRSGNLRIDMPVEAEAVVVSLVSSLMLWKVY